MLITSYKELSDYFKSLSVQNKFIVDFRCCDYDQILSNQSNIKYPCLWMEAVPSLRQSDEDLQEVYTFTVSVLYQEEALEKNRLDKNLKTLSELVEFVARIKSEADENGIEVKAAEYECDFSLSNDKDMRWRVEMQVIINACSEVHADKWKDL